jgi:hypothetical protein
MSDAISQLVADSAKNDGRLIQLCNATTEHEGRGSYAFGHDNKWPQALGDIYNGRIGTRSRKMQRRQPG